MLHEAVSRERICETSKQPVVAFIETPNCNTKPDQMAAELLLCLSKDLLKLFESSAVYDVSITVGDTTNTKIFKAHSAILVSRSPYFAAAFSNNWVKKENN